MTRLPGWSYRGPDPHGFMTAAEVVDYFQGYADAFAAPVREDSAVEHVRPADERVRGRRPRPTAGWPATS